SASWVLPFFAIWTWLSQSPILIGCRRLSSATRTETDEMTTRAAAKSLDPARNSKGACNDGFDPLISLGKTTRTAWQPRCLVRNRYLEGGAMLQEVYCVARTDNQAQEIIEKIKRMGIAPDAFAVVAKPEAVDCAAYRASE